MTRVRASGGCPPVHLTDLTLLNSPGSSRERPVADNCILSEAVASVSNSLRHHGFQRIWLSIVNIELLEAVCEIDSAGKGVEALKLKWRIRPSAQASRLS